VDSLLRALKTIDDDERSAGACNRPQSPERSFVERPGKLVSWWRRKGIHRDSSDDDDDPPPCPAAAAIPVRINILAA
jgi:hypothetical protein